MIYIKTTSADENTIGILVEGSIDADGLQPLRDVCRQNLGKKQNVVLHLEGLTGISNEGKDYLREIQGKIALTGMPDYLRLELA